MSNQQTTAISEISTHGKAFVDASGSRFMVRGIALSTAMPVNSTNDLLADVNHTYFKEIILPHLQHLEVNTLRVYSVDPTVSHQKVMSLLADNGIYVMVGLVTKEISVDRMAPNYTPAIYQRGTSVIDEFHKYANTLSFSVGNEVIFPGEMYTILQGQGKAHPGKDAATLEHTCASVLKSFMRDMKAYLKAKGYRQIPVGIAMQDGDQSSVPDANLIGTNVVAQYYAAGKDDERADYIGINTYRYVNPPGGSGPMNAYNSLATEVNMLSIPVFLTESGGLNIPAGKTAPDSTRDWKIVPQMYSNETVSPQLSGQIAFEFFEKKAYHGLFSQNSDTTKSLTEFKYGKNSAFDGGYNNLASEFKKAKALTPVAIASTPTTTSLPANFNPPLVPSPKPDVSLTIENYSDKALKVVQDTSVIGTLPAGSSKSPTSTPLTVSNLWPLLIQEEVKSNWIPVCQVAAGKLKAGIVIKNNVAWGNQAVCNIN